MPRRRRSSPSAGRRADPLRQLAHPPERGGARRHAAGPAGGRRPHRRGEHQPTRRRGPARGRRSCLGDAGARHPEPARAPLAAPNPTARPIRSWALLPPRPEADPELRAAGARAVIAAGDADGPRVERRLLDRDGDPGGRQLAWHAQYAHDHPGQAADGDDGRQRPAPSATRRRARPTSAPSTPSAVGEEAADKASRSTERWSWSPGEYPVILEEYAVADHPRIPVVRRLLRPRASRRAARSWTWASRSWGRTSRSGTTALDPTRAADGDRLRGRPQAAGRPDHAMASRRRWCTTPPPRGRAGVGSTGHGLPAPNPFGPMAWNLFMSPGSSAKEVMLSASSAACG